jgi:hypothetical protein
MQNAEKLVFKIFTLGDMEGGEDVRILKLRGS